MRKIWTIALFVCAMMIGAGQAKAQDTSALLQIAAELLSDQFGVRSNSIYDDSRQYGVPVYDLAPAYAIRSRSRSVSLDRIYSLRRQGLTWSQIARHVGLPAYVVEDMAKRNLLDTDGYWADVVYRRYRVPQRHWLAVRRAGAGWNQAFLASQIARDLRTEPIYVYRSYRATNNWRVIKLPNRRPVTYVPARTSPIYRAWRPLTTTRTTVKSKSKSNSKVSTKRTTKTSPKREVRRTVIKNPAQTIRKTQVRQGGKVKTSVTHSRVKASAKSSAKAQKGHAKASTKAKGSSKVSDKGQNKGKGKG